MKKEIKPLEALQEICGYYYQSPQYKLVENALKEYELMKQTKIIIDNKDISDEDLEKLKNQRMFIGSLEQCEIKPLYDKETQKKLKALDSIKDIINEGYFLLDYPTIVIDVQTSIKKKDYNLLKEVLL